MVQAGTYGTGANVTTDDAAEIYCRKAWFFVKESLEQFFKLKMRCKKFRDASRFCIPVLELWILVLFVYQKFKEM
jgi:hypothetical protein